MPPTLTVPNAYRACDPTSRVRRALDYSGYYALRSIEVWPTDDGVRLTGTLPTYYLKQLAQSLAMNTHGVDRVDDEITVH